MDIKNDVIITWIADVLKDCATVDGAVLFGSRARGDNKERSDYDVAIFGPVSPEDRISIDGAIEELPTLLKIDVVYTAELEEDKFLQNIRKEGIKFYDRESGK